MCSTVQCPNGKGEGGKMTANLSCQGHKRTARLCGRPNAGSRKHDFTKSQYPVAARATVSVLGQSTNEQTLRFVLNYNRVPHFSSYTLLILEWASGKRCFFFYCVLL